MSSVLKAKEPKQTVEKKEAVSDYITQATAYVRCGNQAVVGQGPGGQLAEGSEANIET